MKKIAKTILLTLIIVITVLSLTACTGNKDLNFGKELVKLSTQLDVLNELSAGTADVGVMDSIMAGYYMSQDTNYSEKLMIIEDLILVEESYGIAAKKGNTATITKINQALVALALNGTVGTIAAKYGLTDDVVIDTTKTFDYEAIADKSDWDAIIAKDSITVGYTVFAPIAYTNAENIFVGFDTELAEAVANYYQIGVVFQEIEWDTKEMELNSGTIDFVWNGMTITEERQTNMEISIPYLANKQVAVIRKTDKDLYKTTADMKRAVIAVESGSAAQSCVEKTVTE